MKAIASILAIVLSFTLVFANTNSKKQQIPAIVKSTFKQEYPDVKKAKWEVEDSDFEVSFKIKKMDASAVYDSSGHKKSFEIEIRKNELPIAISEYLVKNYPKAKIKEIAIITSDSNEINYEVSIQKRGKPVDILFDSRGKFLK